MSQRIDEFLSYASQIMHLVDQGDISESEIDQIVMLFREIVDNERRTNVLKLFLRTLSTIPPAAPATNIFEDGNLIIEQEVAHRQSRYEDETVEIDTLPQIQRDTLPPPPSTTYCYIDPSARIRRSIVVNPADLPDK
jgi:hypothetical protein